MHLQKKERDKISFRLSSSMGRQTMASYPVAGALLIWDYLANGPYVQFQVMPISHELKFDQN